jgi:hypothetical protein
LADDIWVALRLKHPEKFTKELSIHFFKDFMVLVNSNLCLFVFGAVKLFELIIGCEEALVFGGKEILEEFLHRVRFSLLLNFLRLHSESLEVLDLV